LRFEACRLLLFCIKTFLTFGRNKIFITLATLPRITLSTGIHKQQPVVLVEFEFNPEIIKKVKTSANATWSQTLKCWYVPEKDFYLNDFFTVFRGSAFIDYSGLKEKKQTVGALQPPPQKMQPKLRVELPPGYLELLDQKRYSDNTIQAYTHYFKEFQNHFLGEELEKISHAKIDAYILALIREKKISPSQQNQRINAIKFYYEKVLKKEKDYYSINRPRKEQKLPDVLSKEEIAAILKATENKKHKCLIALIYSCGLRRSEAINLKLEDIDTNRMLIKIRGAKGNKDRMVQFPASLYQIIQEYLTESRPEIWLFEGQKKEQYSATSVFNVVKRTARNAGIKKKVYPHILRHSYATHFLEQGVDIRFIQEWMGHGSIKTTQLYTHVAKNNYNFRNPLDDIV
jgi:integrase/recombinase XerD